MKTYNALTDDSGTPWEFIYEEVRYRDEGDPEDAPLSKTRVQDFRYRRKGDEIYLALPPWADVAQEWKITLCFFDEDEETGELTFWPVSS